jgi:hypothetical protein
MSFMPSRRYAPAGLERHGQQPRDPTVAQQHECGTHFDQDSLFSVYFPSSPYGFSTDRHAEPSHRLRDLVGNRDRAISSASVSLSMCANSSTIVDGPRIDDRDKGT